MANRTIDKRIALGFTAVVVVAIGLGAVAYSRLAVIQGRAEVISADALAGVHAIRQLEASARTEMALTTEHILTHDSAERAALNLGNAEAFTRNITSAVSSAQLGIIVVLLLAVAVSGGLEWMVNSSGGEADPSGLRAYPLAIAGAGGGGFPFSSASSRATTNVKTSAWWPEAVGCSSVTMNPYGSVATASSGRTNTSHRDDRDETAVTRLRAAARQGRSGEPTAFPRPTARQIAQAIIQ